MTDETTEPAPTPAPTHAPTTTPTASTAASSTDPLTWGTSFDPDRLALLELRIWKAYYRREALKLFGLVVMGLREQAQVSWPRALLAGYFFSRAAVKFAPSTGGYERFAPDVARGYRILGLPSEVDAEEVARRELRWWVVRREIGLSSGEAAGEAITKIYSAIYLVPESQVARAGQLRGMAAELRDRAASVDPDGPTGRGETYWPEVARMLRDSYRALKSSVG